VDDLVHFNGATFAVATTYDVQKYDVDSVEESQTGVDSGASDDTQQQRLTTSSAGPSYNFGKNIMSARQIDVMSGTFGSQLLMRFKWTTAILFLSTG
jgi:hypothetical protein